MAEQQKKEDIVPLGEVATVSLQARIPPFWRQRPSLWFKQFEAAVSAQKISEQHQYNIAVTMLERNDIEMVSDIILNPPATGQYKALKNRLITAYEESEHQQLQKLLTGLELGDQKPSHLLRRMRVMGGKLLNDDALKILWMNQMATQVRAVLSVNTESTLDGLAVMADKIMEQFDNNTVAAVSTPSSTENASDASTPLELLSKQVERLSLEIAELRTYQRAPRRSSFRRPLGTRFRSPARSRTPRDASRPPLDSEWLCRYHFKFGENARRCESPCSRKKQEN